jgi:hypothetical protein
MRLPSVFGHSCCCRTKLPFSLDNMTTFLYRLLFRNLCLLVDIVSLRGLVDILESVLLLHLRVCMGSICVRKMLLSQV